MHAILFYIADMTIANVSGPARKQTLRPSNESVDLPLLSLMCGRGSTPTAVPSPSARSPRGEISRQIRPLGTPLSCLILGDTAWTPRASRGAYCGQAACAAAAAVCAISRALSDLYLHPLPLIASRFFGFLWPCRLRRCSGHQSPRKPLRSQLCDRNRKGPDPTQRTANRHVLCSGADRAASVQAKRPPLWLVTHPLAAATLLSDSRASPMRRRAGASSGTRRPAAPPTVAVATRSCTGGSPWSEAAWEIPRRRDGFGPDPVSRQEPRTTSGRCACQRWRPSRRRAWRWGAARDAHSFRLLHMILRWSDAVSWQVEVCLSGVELNEVRPCGCMCAK